MRLTKSKFWKNPSSQNQGYAVFNKMENTKLLGCTTKKKMCDKLAAKIISLLNEEQKKITEHKTNIINDWPYHLNDVICFGKEIAIYEALNGMVALDFTQKQEYPHYVVNEKHAVVIVEYVKIDNIKVSIRQIWQFRPGSVKRLIEEYIANIIKPKAQKKNTKYSQNSQNWKKKSLTTDESETKKYSHRAHKKRNTDDPYYVFLIVKKDDILKHLAGLIYKKQKYMTAVMHSIYEYSAKYSPLESKEKSTLTTYNRI